MHEYAPQHGSTVAQQLYNRSSINSINSINIVNIVNIVNSVNIVNMHQTTGHVQCPTPLPRNPTKSPFLPPVPVGRFRPIECIENTGQPCFSHMWIFCTHIVLWRNVCFLWHKFVNLLLRPSVGNCCLPGHCSPTFLG